MKCASCGTENDGDARYCDGCGADLTGAPRPAEGPKGKEASRPAPPAAPQPLVVYASVRPRAWWYPIGVWVLLSSFFLFVDLVPGDGIGWAHWPIGVLGIFMVGFPLLHLVETFVAERSRRKG